MQKPDGSSYGRTTLKCIFNGLQRSIQYFVQDHKDATGEALHLPLIYEDAEFEDFVRALDLKLKQSVSPCYPATCLQQPADFIRTLIQPDTCRVTREGLARTKQAMRFEDSEIKLIAERSFCGDDCRSFTMRKFFAFSWVLCTRGESEQHDLLLTDFTLQQLPGGREVLRYDPSTAFKNYQGGIKERKNMVCV